MKRITRITTPQINDSTNFQSTGFLAIAIVLPFNQCYICSSEPLNNCFCLRISLISEMRLMRKILLLCCLLGLGSLLPAQTLTIKNERTLEPIEYATIIGQNGRLTAVTDLFGKADITIFQDAEDILIRCLGYESLVLNYTEMDTADFNILLKPTQLSLNEIVVSATRWQESSINVPSKIISISPEEITLQNPQTAADLLGISGNVFIQKSQQGGGSPMIRGFATNRLIYTVDGVRMNNAIFRGGNLQNVINLNPFTAENVEVLFGPASVTYGSDAIGGVMSFQTLTPQFTETETPLITGKAIARYSSANNEQTGHFDINIGGQKWAFVTSLSAWDYDHLRQGNKGPEDYIKDYFVQRQNEQDVIITQSDPLLQIPSAYSQMNLMQKVRFQPNQYLDFQYGFHFSTTSPYGRYDRHNRMRNGAPRHSEWNYGSQQWLMNNLNVYYTKETNVFDRMTLRVAQQSFEESRISRSFNDTERRTQVEQVDAYSINLDLVKPLSSKNTIFYGIEYVLNEVESIGTLTDISDNTSQVGAARYPFATWQSMAAYLNHEWKVNNALILQTGLRYNQFMLDADFSNNLDFFPLPFTTANINNGAFTGSVGGVYRPTETWAVKANIGSAFRAPNVDDIGKVFDSEPGAVVVPNPALDAEYAYNFDLGFVKVFNDIIKVDVTGYYTILENALVRRNFQLNGQDSLLYEGIPSRVQAIQNAAQASVYGVQLGLEVKLPNGFSLISDLSYQVGEEELEDGSTSASRHAAPMFGITRLNYQKDELQLQFYANYQAAQPHEDLAVSEQSKREIYALDENGNTFAPAWYTLNLKASYALSEIFSLTTGIENITDQRYRPYSSGISGAGRNFILSVTARF